MAPSRTNAKMTADRLAFVELLTRVAELGEVSADDRRALHRLARLLRKAMTRETLTVEQALAQANRDVSELVYLAEAQPPGTAVARIAYAILEQAELAIVELTESGSVEHDIATRGARNAGRLARYEP